ncbi:glycerate kinase [Rossellomorea vietnamensis]|uniref:Glycerate kinase n=1 Tax=Rossellomorea vietnamensis TaxID=218284 RepID=A0ACD4C334_9BACI|nr:glycerate kinase [Rossellomorea vietnamensis]UXH43025.1 glycerate kinase [Rossellomorea vietnamensis]
MNILIAPDSFKGSLSSLEVGIIMEKAFLDESSSFHTNVIPMADGGEGTLETLIYATGGKKIKTTATGPLGVKIPTEYGVLGDQKTAVIEIASIAGLTMVPPGKRNPFFTTTKGIGEVIISAVESGLRDFIIALGGSSTNDGGFGMLQALGITFLDEKGIAVGSFGKDLGSISKVDWSTLHPAVRECSFHIASDVENPLCGKTGASTVFGPQKGATEEQVKILDQQLFHFSKLLQNEKGINFRDAKGAGAAGGLGFAFLHLDGITESGAKLVAEASNLTSAIQVADWILTGEGQSDSQTLFGKLPSYIATIANQHHTPISLIAGALGKGYQHLYKDFTSCHSIAIGPMDLHESIRRAEELLYHETRNLARILHVTKSL